MAGVDALISALQRARGVQPAGVSAAVDSFEELRFVNSRSAGDVWALWQLWRTLGLDELALAWRRSRTEIDVLACLRAMVFNRLCDPQSKLGVLRWLQTVALPANFGFTEDCAPSTTSCCAPWTCSTRTVTRSGRGWPSSCGRSSRGLVGGVLRPHHGGGLRRGGGRRRRAAYGKSKSGLGAPVRALAGADRRGPADRHEVHPGNVGETKTLMAMIKRLLARYPLKRVVLVADRGMLS